MDLVLVFTALMAFAILAYVLLDGYDLGVGMLMPAAEREEQELMVGTIAPYWDANETWLVLGIGLLLVAFPVAHGEVLGALYLPVAAMLVGLMLRGVAFELRVKAEGWHRELWNWLFWAGSTLASFAQGLMLGRYVTGFDASFGAWLFAIAIGVWVWRVLGESDTKPFAGAVSIFVLAFIGLAYSLFPYVVMDRLTIWDAAADRSALVFLGVGVLIVLPFIAGYTVYAYRVFRGKV